MSDSSEDSEGIGYLVEGPDRDGPDDESSESGSEPAHGGFLDLEAADSDEEASDMEEDEDGYDTETDADLEYFPQFMRLPIELRHLVWEFFCPDLTAKSRVYEVMLSRHRLLIDDIGPGPFLEQQTLATRAVLAVHRESRQLALKAFPDTLPLSMQRKPPLLRFNFKSDVVHLHYIPVQKPQPHQVVEVPGFGEQIRHLALGPGELSDPSCHDPSGLYGAFKNLETVYYITDTDTHRPRNLRWCTSDLIHRYTMTGYEEQAGLLEEIPHVYCYPDLKDHRDFAEQEIPVAGMAIDASFANFSFENVRFHGLKVWPMIHFMWATGLLRFEELQTWDGEEDLGWIRYGLNGDVEGDEDSESDDYESEGIDDSDIGEDEMGSDSDDLAVLDDDDSDEEDEGDEDAALEDEDSDGVDDDEQQEEEGAEDGSPIPSDVGNAPRGTAMVDLTGSANFSSPEQSSATLQGSDQSEDESDQPPAPTSRPKRSRSQIVDSDSDDDLDDVAPRKRARTAVRRHTAVLSSDEEGAQGARGAPLDSDNGEDEEDVGPRKQTRAKGRRNPIVLSSDDDVQEERRKMRANRRARAVLSEDEDENEDEDEGTANQGRAEDGDTFISSSDDDDEDEDEDEEGGAAVARPLSLAKKLQLHRERVPIPQSDDDDDDGEGDEDPDIEEMGDDDYDARNYARFEDDEDGNEISDEGDHELELDPDEDEGY